jgi:hypothetical protein
LLELRTNDAISVVGRFLRKHTILKTIDEVSKTELEKSGEMVAILTSQIEEKNRYLLAEHQKLGPFHAGASHMQQAIFWLKLFEKI